MFLLNVFVGAFILNVCSFTLSETWNWTCNVHVNWRERWQKTAVCIYIVLMENRCFYIMCVFKAWWNLLWLKLCSANIHVSVCQSFQTSFNLHGVTEPVFLQTALTTSMIKNNFLVSYCSVIFLITTGVDRSFLSIQYTTMIVKSQRCFIILHFHLFSELKISTCKFSFLIKLKWYENSKYAASVKSYKRHKIYCN